MSEHLREAVSGLVGKGMATDEVDELFRAMKNGVLMDPEVGTAIRAGIVSDGELRFRFVAQAEAWMESWEYPPELLAPARHFAVQVANLYAAV